MRVFSLAPRNLISAARSAGFIGWKSSLAQSASRYGPSVAGCWLSSFSAFGVAHPAEPALHERAVAFQISSMPAAELHAFATSG